MKKQRYLFLTLSVALIVGALTNAAVVSAAERIRFEISIDAALVQQPVSGRLLIFMTSQTRPLTVIQPDFLNPRSIWVAGTEVRNMVAGKVVDVDPDAHAFPGAFSTAPAGDYQTMALLDVDHSYNYNGMGAGDLYCAVATLRNLNPAATAAVT